MADRYDVVVVGAGHAGVEAAAAAARIGARVLCVTLRLDRIAHLPCNCSIGGPGKGQIAREVDALGGMMAQASDWNTTHIRRVGTGKGPAVQTLRAQVCKAGYPRWVAAHVRRLPSLTLSEGSAGALALRGGRVCGVAVDGAVLEAGAVVLTAGTFLDAVCHEGTSQTAAARHGEPAAVGLGGWLRTQGFVTRRFKTGTTPRVASASVCFEATEEVPSEPDAGALSFLFDQLPDSGPHFPTWRTATNEVTHAVLRRNLGRSAMFGGAIVGTGPRFCPSVEDKVVRFAERSSHPVFLERESREDGLLYVQGFSTSMPAEVQAEALRTVRGLEAAEIVRPGYAVEYDSIDPTQLDSTLMAKDMPGLFCAGQLNGTSGYEEAAGQGLLAGANAARFALGLEPLRLPRHTSYIGVMVDDLVTRGADDPYRMLTGRAEHRLVLRHDNADQRLTPIGRRHGLVGDARMRRFEQKMERLDRAREWAATNHVTEHEAEEGWGLGPVAGRASYWQLLRRPGVGPVQLAAAASALGQGPDPGFDDPVWALAEVESKFDGYLVRQAEEVARAERFEALAIPSGTDYSKLRGLSHEGREKLAAARPSTIGQASRVPGVRPSDVALLIGQLRG
jgi:tRNA uridine 5-carboxymethylaminomethyl modification enzyme